MLHFVKDVLLRHKANTVHEHLLSNYHMKITIEIQWSWNISFTYVHFPLLVMCHVYIHMYKHLPFSREKSYTICFS